jgi:hypothetical protein
MLDSPWLRSCRFVFVILREKTGQITPGMTVASMVVLGVDKSYSTALHGHIELALLCVDRRCLREIKKVL